MFSNLIESGSHAADLKRKGRFFLATTVFYGVLLALTGVGSIYAYNVKLNDSSEYELISLMRFPPADAREPETRREERRAASSPSRQNQLTVRREISTQTPYHGDRIARADTPEVRPNERVVISNFNFTPADGGGPVGPTRVGPSNGVGSDTGPSVTETVEPPPAAVPTPKPQPTPQQTGPVRLPSSLISSKTLEKPAPPYPAIAKAAGVQGAVAVQIVIDENGKVLSAKATSGHPLLQSAAVQAAYRAKFTPTVLGGQPVKVTGSITYNFVLQ